MAPFKNALISVSDKTGLIELIKPLAEQGMRVVSTGGTAAHLRNAGINVVDVSEQTGFDEVMDGRVKTLHPNVHMALLARSDHEGDRAVLERFGVEPFDLVVVNLYPFEAALTNNRSRAELIEKIDVGGPSMIRAAAKNFERITVLVNPEDYPRALEKKSNLELREELAARAFAHIGSYDAMISQALSRADAYPHHVLGGSLVQSLRYGENPQQKAYWYRRRGAEFGLHEAEVLQGKALSYNNLLDLDSALGLLRELEGPSAVAVKHGNPCGVASGSTIEAAVRRCLSADPVSVFGGIVALNHSVTDAVATELNSLFLECVIAPQFVPSALEILAKKKNLRVMKWPDLALRDSYWRVASLQGGYLLQEPDRVHHWSTDWLVLGESPSPQTRSDLSFAWAVAAYLKSNAIAIAGGGQSLGLGMGQVNRVDAVEIAISRFKKHHAHVTGCVLASDAFFPFADSIDLIHEAGIRWVIQPGGSIKDDEVKARARDLGINMVLTGQRHFRH